jgi:hypothetical protein
LIGGLLQGESVCEGYAEIIRNVLACRGIESRCIYSASHAYNQVKINGKWYYCDLTWDRDNIFNRRNLRYCLLSEERMRKNHNTSIGQVVEESPETYPQEIIQKKAIEIQQSYEKINAKNILIEGYQSSEISTSKVVEAGKNKQQEEGNLNRTNNNYKEQ